MKLPIRTYHDALKYIFSKEFTSGVKYSLEHVSRVNQLLGSPDSAYKIIHIAGTNGK